MNKPVIIIGSGGHASVLYNVLKLLNRPVIGITDLSRPKDEKIFNDCKIIGNDSEILTFNPDKIDLVNGIGSLPNNRARRLEVAKRFRDLGYHFTNVIHPSSIISRNINFDDGVQIMAGTVIQNNTKIGLDSIVNTASVIDHDCVIGKNCHISPNATICGSVIVGDDCHVGAGSTIIQNICIGRNSIIAAGTTVYKNIDENLIAKNDTKMSFDNK